MIKKTTMSLDDLYKALDWFIPKALREEAETLRRVRMFMISHLFGPFLGHTITLYLLVLAPGPDLTWGVLFGAITLFWVFPIGLKLNIPYQALALLSVQTLTFAILWGCYNYGGLNSPFMPWVITIPLLAFFYLGSSRGVQAFVVGLIAPNLFLFYALSDGGRMFPEHIQLASLSGLGIVSTLCAAAYVSMMALYYAKIVNSQPELEREVARRLETADRLRQATKEADLANRAKSEFLAKISHELRTPLNAVIGFSDMLLEDRQDTGEDQRYVDLEKINQAGERLLVLINDLLDLSKLDVGKMEIFLEPLDVTALVEAVTASCQTQIAAGGNTLRLNCAAGAAPITGDATKLGQVLTNLISNAAKFTHEGTIGVDVTRNDEWLTITVTDTGLGISPARLRTLFESFDEDEAATTSKYSEVGLGLPLSAKLCQLMGGTLTAESKLKSGSRFEVRIPTLPEGRTASAETSRFMAAGAAL